MFLRGKRFGKGNHFLCVHWYLNFEPGELSEVHVPAINYFDSMIRKSDVLSILGITSAVVAVVAAAIAINNVQQLGRQ